MKHTFKLMGIIVILFLCLQAPCDARDVTLQWNPNMESELAGYKIYYDFYSDAPYYGEDANEGRSPIIVSIEELNDPDNPEFTLTGLDETDTYFFAITAYDHESLESDLSNEGTTGADGEFAVLNEASSDSSTCFIRSAISTHYSTYEAHRVRFKRFISNELWNFRNGN